MLDFEELAQWCLKRHGYVLDVGNSRVLGIVILSVGDNSILRGTIEYIDLMH